MDMSLLIKAAIIAGSIAIGFGIKHLTTSKIEIVIVDKIAEKILEEETGIDVDFATDMIISIK
jgi:hypothetical protein